MSLHRTLVVYLSFSMICLAAFRVSGFSSTSLRGIRVNNFTRKDRKYFSSAVSSTNYDVDNLKILRYPHPALRNENSPVNVDDNAEMEMVRLTSRRMFDLMYATGHGAGLAAPQVGINKRYMVFNKTGDPKKWLEEMTFINPQILESSESKEFEREGCLSFPGMNGTVLRSKWVKIEATNLKGKKIKKKFVGWEARLFQHEYDHLQGIVYPDLLSEEEKNADAVKGRLQELVTEFGEGGIL